MYSPTIVQQAIELHKNGENAVVIGHQLHIPRSTVAEWIQRSKKGELSRDIKPLCLGCGTCVHSFDRLDSIAYSYLLGMYLGDGCLSQHPRKVYKLRICLDTCYPNIIQECCDAITQILPGGKARKQIYPKNYTEVNSYSKQWPCLFPQHEPGKKHERKIALQPWQSSLVEKSPQAFLRGLHHSDGSRGIAQVKVRSPNGTKHEYAYPRYWFKNYSVAISKICILLRAELTWV